MRSALFLCFIASAAAARTTAGGQVHDLPTANTATSSNTGLAWQLHAHTNTHASRIPIPAHLLALLALPRSGLAANPDCSHVTCSIKKHTCAKFNKDAQTWSPKPGAAFQWGGNHNSPFAAGQALTHNFDSDECDGTDHYSVVVNHHNSENVCTAASGGHHCGLGVITGGSACECKPGKVNGAWGTWGDFTACLNGKRTRTRECNNPAPRGGGSLCVGDNFDEDTAGCTAVDNRGRLYISEYVEGSHWNKAIELTNPTGSAMSLDGVVVQWHHNGATYDSSGNYDVPLTGKTIAAGGTFVLCRDENKNDSEQVPADKCDMQFCYSTKSCAGKSIATNAVLHTGDDAVELLVDGKTTDVIGEVGTDPGSCWKDAQNRCMTKDKTIRRKISVATGNTVWTSSEWDIFSKNDVSGLGQ